MTWPAFRLTSTTRARSLAPMVVSCTGRMVPTAVSTIGRRTSRTSATIPGASSSLAETRSVCIDTLGANLPANDKRSTVTLTEKTSKIAARLPQATHLGPILLFVFMRHQLPLLMECQRRPICQRGYQDDRPLRDQAPSQRQLPSNLQRCMSSLLLIWDKRSTNRSTLTS